MDKIIKIPHNLMLNIKQIVTTSKVEITTNQQILNQSFFIYY